MGLMSAALRAGSSPASVPATTMTMVTAMHTSSPTVGLLNMVASKVPLFTFICPIVAFMYSLAAMPSSMPT